MDEQDKTIQTSKASNVQLLEIKPAPKGMSFSAQLEKFYLNSEILNNDAATVAKANSNSVTNAQDLVKGGAVKKEAKN